MKKKYMYDIIFFSFMLIIALVLLFTGKLLKVSNSFLLGIVTGMIVGCIIIISRIIKKRKSMKHMADEREQQLMMKSMSISHSATIAVVAILSVIARSTTWSIPMALQDIFTILLLFMVTSYFLIYTFLSRKY